MAGKVIRLRLNRSIVATAIVIFAGSSVHGQVQMSLAEAARRIPPNYTAAHNGETIQVRGVVPVSPVYIAEYTEAIIQDATGAGLTIQGSHDLLGPLRAGQDLEITGTIAERAGLPVLAG